METTKKELKQMYHDMVSVRYAFASEYIRGACLTKL